MAKKKGPPYVNPGGKFLVISQPWGMHPAQQRRQVCYDSLGAWVRFMFHQPGADHKQDALVELVWSRGTVCVARSLWVRSGLTISQTEDVIVKLPDHLDITPMLGAHRWGEFLVSVPQNRANNISYVFEYNYTNNGDPSRRADISHLLTFCTGASHIHP